MRADSARFSVVVWEYLTQSLDVLRLPGWNGACVYGVLGNLSIYKGCVMARFVVAASVLWGVVVLGGGVCLGADDGLVPESAVTAWALGGSEYRELRVGTRGWGILPDDVEIAVGGVNRDGPDDYSEWAGRGYALFHAVDANMVAQLLGRDVKLPPGTAYIGGFAEYSADRQEEFSGGLIAGALVRWPGNWCIVAEYQWELFNVGDRDYSIIIGLRRELY